MLPSPPDGEYAHDPEGPVVGYSGEIRDAAGKIPPPSNMFFAIFTGLLLSMLTVAIHATGTAWWVSRLRLRAQRRESNLRFAVILRVLITTVLLLISLHLIEVLTWAAAYWALPGISQIDSAEEAIYFSTVTFTTLGYGDITLISPWRMLSAVQAAVGMLIFGWSTAMLFTVVQRIWEERPRNG